MTLSRSQGRSCGLRSLVRFLVGSALAGLAGCAVTLRADQHPVRGNEVLPPESSSSFVVVLAP